MKSLWTNLSVTKKLYSVVGLMALLIVFELLTLNFVMNTLSAVRSFVGGEGLWSKAQKSAVHSLQKYALTGNEKYFEEYNRNLQVPLGDREARFELEKPNPNVDLVFQGFAKGGVHPKDIPNLIWLITEFHEVSYIAKAITVWREGDAKLDELIVAGKELQSEIRSKNQRARVVTLLENIYRIDGELTVIENHFSSVLGEGSRWLEGLLMLVLICAVFTVESTGLFLTFSFSRTLSRSLKEMNQAATEVGKGNFDLTVPVRSTDELGQLAGAINKMSVDLRDSIGERKVAENANQIKTMFLANMSHEIRTPLGVILGLTEILKNDNLSPADRRKYLDIIDRTGHNVSQIINDILDISKVEAGYLEIEKTIFPLPDFLKELHSMISVHALLKKNNVIFTGRGSLPKEIATDQNRLKQILVNLLNNASKFTNKGQIRLTYWTSSTHLHFEISDNGIGMDEDQKQNLFNLFYQADLTATRKYQGTGLGLALSKRLAKALGGDVVLAESHPNKGSTFVVTIPLDDTLTTTGQTDTELETPDGMLEGKKILVVEDNKDNQLLVSLFLQNSGAILEFASDGEEGCQQALSRDYDVILMDIQMPVMDGYMATQRLRSAGCLKPIIALTAHAMHDEKSKCLKAGCSEYLAKPVSSSKLYHMIVKCLS